MRAILKLIGFYLFGLILVIDNKNYLPITLVYNYLCSVYFSIIYRQIDNILVENSFGIYESQLRIS